MKDNEETFTVPANAACVHCGAAAAVSDSVPCKPHEATLYSLDYDTHEFAEMNDHINSRLIAGLHRE